MTNAETAAPVGFFHPTRPIYRFTNLLFIASLTFGSYFAYDIIGAIAPSLIKGLNASRATLGAFNTMYSVAAILVLLFAGVLIDIIMIRDRLRVLEQNINSNEKLSKTDKVNLQQYITRCYGSLTSFNALFADRKDWFVGEKANKILIVQIPESICLFR